MLAADVVVAGGGVAGLLIASALGKSTSVIVLEQADNLPRDKHWLTDQSAADAVPDFQGCVDCKYDFLDYLAYDGLKATVTGRYCLWDTDKLIGCMTDQLPKPPSNPIAAISIRLPSSPAIESASPQRGADTGLPQPRHFRSTLTTSRPLWLTNFVRVACQTDRDLGNIRRIIERCIATRFTGRPWEGIICHSDEKNSTQYRSPFRKAGSAAASRPLPRRCCCSPQ